MLNWVLKHEVTHGADESARHRCLLHLVHCCLGNIVGPGNSSVSRVVGLFGRLLGNLRKVNRKSKYLTEFTGNVNEFTCLYFSTVCVVGKLFVVEVQHAVTFYLNLSFMI